MTRLGARGVGELAARLTELSRQRHVAPWGRFEWPARLAPNDGLAASPDAMLAGCVLSRALDEPGLEEPTVRELALAEARAFFSMNVHGERRLVAGAALLLGTPGADPVADYLVHLIEEEVHHTALFREFCDRYAGGVLPDRKVDLHADRDHQEEHLLFFARVVLFEEIADAVNQRTAADERVHPLVRAIHAYHAVDEARHLAFGRAMLADLVARVRADQGEAALDRTRSALTLFLEVCLADLLPVEVARVIAPEGAAKRVHALRRDPRVRARFSELTARARRSLERAGLPLPSTEATR